MSGTITIWRDGEVPAGEVPRKDAIRLIQHRLWDAPMYNRGLVKAGAKFYITKACVHDVACSAVRTALEPYYGSPDWVDNESSDEDVERAYWRVVTRGWNCEFTVSPKNFIFSADDPLLIGKRRCQFCAPDVYPPKKSPYVPTKAALSLCGSDLGRAYEGSPIIGIEHTDSAIVIKTSDGSTWTIGNPNARVALGPRAPG